MIVCDKCQDIKKKASIVFFTVSKEEEKKGKLNERVMIRTSRHFCETCLDKAHTLLGALLNRLDVPE